MPTKKSVNRSQAIRDYKAKHPDKGPSEIAAALSKRGMKVSPNLVSMALKPPKKGAKKTGSKQRRTAKRRIARTSNHGSGIAALMRAKAFAQEMGGIEQAKRVLAELERLQA